LTLIPVHFHSFAIIWQTILKLQTKILASRVSDQNITLSLTDAGADWVIGQAFEPQYGARPLRRYMDKVVGTQLSRTIISGELLPHSDVAIDADPRGDRLLYRISRKAGVSDDAATGSRPKYGAV
jgi:ATP-dependent Clp protease ATP-binding subunit ClpA